MKGLYRTYREFSCRTRWFGLLLAILLLVVLLAENGEKLIRMIWSLGFYHFFVLLSPFRILLLLSILLTTIRVFSLIRKDRPSQMIASVSWVGLLVTLLFAIGLASFGSEPLSSSVVVCIPREGHVCYSISGGLSQGFWPTALYAYLILGFIGMLMKLALALWKYLHRQPDANQL